MLMVLLRNNNRDDGAAATRYTQQTKGENPFGVCNVFVVVRR